MLQRIQSVYLLLAGLVILLLFLFPLVHNVAMGGLWLTIKVTGVSYFHINEAVPQHGESFIGLSIATFVVGLFPLYLIFQYKNRKRQINLCYLYILVVIGYSFWISQTVKGYLASDGNLNIGNFGIGALLSSVSILLTIMAFKAMQRDEKLVKSADRLR